MKLATLRNGTRDGQLVVVSRDLMWAMPVPSIAPTLQAALDDWARISPRLHDVCDHLTEGYANGAVPFDQKAALAPLPRAHHWVDGSAYVNHVELVRKARNADMPPSFWTDPLVYQGGSDDFIPPMADVPVPSEDYGIDLEGEVAVITDDVPMMTAVDEAAGHVKLVMLVNDWSLRNLIPAELAKGFGFYQSKPATSFSPCAITPDELGEAWAGSQSAPAAGVAHQRQALRPAERGRRHDVRFRATDRARDEDATARRRRGHRFGNGVQLRSLERIVLPGGNPGARADRRRQGDHAIPAVWRPCADRDVRPRRREPVRRD